MRSLILSLILLVGLVCRATAQNNLDNIWIDELKEDGTFYLQKMTGMMFFCGAEAEYPVGEPQVILQCRDGKINLWVVSACSRKLDYFGGFIGGPEGRLHFRPLRTGVVSFGEASEQKFSYEGLPNISFRDIFHLRALVAVYSGRAEFPQSVSFDFTGVAKLLSKREACGL